MNFDKEFKLFKAPGVATQKMTSLCNMFLHKIGVKVTFSSMQDHSTIMVSPFQKINFYHFLNSLIAYNVKGEFVELGCFEGQTATMFQRIIEENKSTKKLFLYDNFIHNIGLDGDIKQRLINNFKNANVSMPTLIEGDFEVTLPAQLPESIAFVHIDCGYGGDHDAHKKVVLHCLESSYDRMSPGAVGILMDYHDKEITVDGFNSNPGVKLACDIFFKDKPEKMYTLYGGDCSHGYFRKGAR